MASLHEGYSVKSPNAFEMMKVILTELETKSVVVIEPQEIGVTPAQAQQLAVSVRNVLNRIDGVENVIVNIREDLAIEIRAEVS